MRRLIVSLFTAWFAYIQQQRFAIEVHPGDGFPAVTVSPSPEGSESQAKRHVAATSTTDAPAPRTPEVLHTRVVAVRPVKAGHINKAGNPTLVDMKGLDSVVVVAPRCTKDDLENAGLADDCVLRPVPDKPYRVVMGPGSRLRVSPHHPSTGL